MAEVLQNTNPMIPSKGKIYIVCAAIWYSDGIQYDAQPKNIDLGYVMCGRRHHNIIILHAELLNIKTAKKNTVQGFLTSDDRFVTRKQAGKIAFECGQISKESNCLTSEELY